MLFAAALAGAPALGEERLAVLEFLARQSTFCIAGAPAVVALQQEYAGRAVLLEYDFDAPAASGRYQCYRAADPYGAYLPLVMVGSGFRTAAGPIDYEPIYRGMIEQELGRAPEAAIAAYWRRQGEALRVYVQAENRSGAALAAESGAAIWVLVWENAHVRLTDTWVRAAVKSPLVAPLAPGGAATATLDTPALTGASWDRIECLAMLERRTAPSARYDMLQAAIASPAELTVSPSQVVLSAGAPATDVTLSGPHALAWTAESDTAWLEVVPASGSIPATVAIRLSGAAPPRGERAGTIHFVASGDGMSFTSSLEVSVVERTGTIRRRLTRANPAPAPIRER